MNESYWILSSKSKEYKKLNEDIETECLIVGGGITGITTAYLLAKKGVDVTVVDSYKIGYGASGRNTGKLTAQHDDFYSKIEKKYGFDTAKLYYEANSKALNLVESIIKENNISCHFERVPAYIFTEDISYVQDIKDEYDTCKKIGIECEYHDTLELPLDIKAAMSFKKQAQFNPKQYIDALADAAIEVGAKIYENTHIIDLEKGQTCKLKTKDENIIRAENVVISSHAPWYDSLNLYFAKEIAERSYLLGAIMKKDLPKGMFINLEDPSRTFRTYEGEGKRLLIVGGGDHKVGQGGKEGEIYDRLKNYAHDTFEVENIKYQWSTQDYMSFDNLPFIGYISKDTDNIYVATGYSKWGMSNGTVAAMIISDLMVEKKSKYKEVFNPSRKGSYFTKDFIKENVDVVVNYVGGKLNLGSDEMPKEKGEGKTITIDGKRYGAYRHFNDKLYIVDITCTHLGCELHFNGAEQTWDCPCHGSRFDYEGNVIEGPAIKPLNRYGEGKNSIDPKLV